MARVFKISNESDIPDWFTNQKPTQFLGSQADADRILKLPAELSEETFTNELDVIEKCASAGAPYFYSTRWGTDVTDRLQEFATAYGVKSIGADPDDKLVVEAATPILGIDIPVVKTASVGKVEIPDPFKIDSKGDMSHMKKADWQQPSSEAKALPPDIFMNSGACIRLSGSEDTRVHSPLKAIPGQNSITNPDAIKELAGTEDTGTRLRREATERAAQRKTAHQEWELNVVKESQETPDSATKGSVLKIDIAPAGGKNFGSMHLKAPDKTEGEQLGEMREARRKDIQRDVTDEREWDGLQGTTKAKVGDLLMAGLEERMKKLGVKTASTQTGIKKSAWFFPEAPAGGQAKSIKTPPDRTLDCSGCELRKVNSAEELVAACQGEEISSCLKLPRFAQEALARFPSLQIAYKNGKPIAIGCEESGWWDMNDYQVRLVNAEQKPNDVIGGDLPPPPPEQPTSIASAKSKVKKS
jgi:hypothetical protein